MGPRDPEATRSLVCLKAGILRLTKNAMQRRVFRSLSSAWTVVSALSIVTLEFNEARCSLIALK